MFKLVVNQLDKIFITSDAATVVKEMEVVHPAAKLIVEAAQKQEQEVAIRVICEPRSATAPTWSSRSPASFSRRPASCSCW